MNSGATSPTEGITIRDWSQISSELIFIYDGAISQKHLTLRGRFQDLSAVLIREGGAIVEGPHGEVAHAGPGDWVFTSEGERSQRFLPGSCVLSIHFLLSWPGRLPVYVWDGAVTVPSTEFPEMREAGERLMNYVAETMGIDGKRVRYSLRPLRDFFGLYRYFLHWLEMYTEALTAQGIHPTRQGVADPRVLKVAQLLDRRSFQDALPQAELAAEVNLSVNQLTRIFRNHFRMTPKAYMERRRAREAYLRVQNSKDSFKEIAYDLGFHSPAHFSTWFGQQFSHTPREVREHGHNLFPAQL